MHIGSLNKQLSVDHYQVAFDLVDPDPEVLAHLEYGRLNFRVIDGHILEVTDPERDEGFSQAFVGRLNERFFQIAEKLKTDEQRRVYKLQLIADALGLPLK